MDVINYKCPSCGAPLVFKSENQEMGCDSCGSSFSVKEIEEYYNPSISNEEYEAVKEYECPSCGAEIITDETTAATTCPYCGNTTVLSEKFNTEEKPKWIIPFKVNKQKAIDTLKSYYKGKAFLPKEFISENKIQEIKGVYVPFWLWDCDVEADATYKATKVTTWSDSDYNYRKTDYYNLIRRGEVEFTKIPIDGSAKIDNTLMEAIEPFDYNQIENFSTTYLSGYLAEKYDVEASESDKRIKERIVNSVEDMIRGTVSNTYSSVIKEDFNMESQKASHEYALFPVWLLNTRYKDKTYTFVMNGQTGKFIGNLPVSKGKFFAWFAGLSAAFSLGGFLIALACAAGGIL